MSAELDVKGIWKQVRDRIHHEIIHRGLWDATEHAVPLIIDENTLIVGLDPAKFSVASYLTTQQHRVQIEAMLQQMTGQRLSLRVIEGVDDQAWERTKAREAANVEQALDSHGLRAENRTALQAYESCQQALHKMAIELGARHFAEKMAKLLIRALPLIVEAEDTARAAKPEAEDMHFQQMNRIFDRLGAYAEIPPTMAALEYYRYRAAKKRQ